MGCFTVLCEMVRLVVEKEGAEVDRLFLYKNSCQICFQKEFGGTDGTLSKDFQFKFSRH